MKAPGIVNLVIVICFNIYNPANAQTRTAAITGDNCAGSTLTAALSTGIIKEIKWYKDTTLVLVRTNYNRNSLLVTDGSATSASPTRFYDPKGIFVDKKNNIYIVTADRVQRWSNGYASGVTVAGGNGKGTALNQLASPIDVVVDDNRNVYVSDNLSNSVRKWAPGANAGKIVAGGAAGSAANQLNGPHSICMDKAGNLYVADRFNHRVQKWAPGATAGVTVAGGNGKGSAANQLNEPYGVGVDSFGNVYVTDTFNYRVQKWAPGAASGITVAGGNGQGMGARQLFMPNELSVDSLGTVYVIDYGRIQRWSPGANYGVTIGGGYGYGSGPAETDKVGTSFGIHVNETSLNVYISDYFANSVRRFKPTANYSDQLVNAPPGIYHADITASNDKVMASKPFNVLPIPTQPENIKGPAVMVKNSIRIFSVNNPIPGIIYSWTAPDDAVILSGQNTTSISIKWGTTSGYLNLFASNACGISKPRSKPIQATDPPAALMATTNTNPVITLYPNPTVGYASLAFKAEKQSKYEVVVTNMMGRQVHRQTGTTTAGANKVDFNIGNLQKAVYIVNVKYDDGTSKIMKISKE